MPVLRCPRTQGLICTKNASECVLSSRRMFATFSSENGLHAHVLTSELSGEETPHAQRGRKPHPSTIVKEEEHLGNQ